MSVDLPSSDTAAVVVSIVVPVRNEAENVSPLVAEITAALDGRWAYEIIYVNDGSTDATAERLAALMQQRGNLRQLRHATSSGQSAAVRSGVRAARTPLRTAADWPDEVAWPIWRRFPRCFIIVANRAAVASVEPSLT